MSGFAKATHRQHIANYELRVAEMQAMAAAAEERCAGYAADIEREQTEQKAGSSQRIAELERATGAAQVKSARYVQDVERLTTQIELRREHLGAA